jgi:hypothetical protein
MASVEQLTTRRVSGKPLRPLQKGLVATYEQSTHKATMSLPNGFYEAPGRLQAHRQLEDSRSLVWTLIQLLGRSEERDPDRSRHAAFDR